MTAEKPMTARARKPADLLAYVPYLLGFHPHDSLVLVGIRDTRVVFGCRLDLPAPGEQDPDFTEGLARLAETATANHLTAEVIIGYGQASQVGPAVLQAQQLFRARGLTVVDVLRVTDGRYWSYVCTDPGCCPPEGTVADPATSTIAAQAVLAGMVALPDRVALAATVQPVQGPARAAMTRATTIALGRLEELLHSDATESAPASRIPTTPTDAATILASIPSPALVQAGATALREVFEQRQGEERHVGEQLSDDDAAWLTLLLTHIPVRDLAAEHFTHQPQHLALWTDLTRRAHPDLVAAPASLAGLAAWRHGNGPLACAALERALAADPTYTMAKLLLRAVSSGMSPAVLGDPTAPINHNEPGNGQ